MLLQALVLLRTQMVAPAVDVDAEGGADTKGAVDTPPRERSWMWTFPL